MVVPFAAGGPMDTFGRILALRMSELLRQQVVVENVGGAGGMTGSARVAKATPDGYQFVLGNVGTHAASQTFYKNPLYNAATDFTPVGLYAEVAVPPGHAQGPAGRQTLREFAAHAKANQAQMQYGSGGSGSATPPRLRAVEHRARRQRHACPLPRRRAGDAGPDRRPHRLPVPR